MNDSSDDDTANDNTPRIFFKIFIILTSTAICCCFMSFLNKFIRVPQSESPNNEELTSHEQQTNNSDQESSSDRPDNNDAPRVDADHSSSVQTPVVTINDKLRDIKPQAPQSFDVILKGHSTPNSDTTDLETQLPGNTTSHWSSHDMV